MGEELTTNPVEKSEKKDVSKATIIILVILTLVISILGTWTVLNEVTGIQRPVSIQPQNGPAQANIELNILPIPKPVSATGKVILDIQKPK